MKQPEDKVESRVETGGGPLIYVVDDEPLLLELALAILKPLGYEVKTFGNAEAALPAFSAANPKPDVLVTDFAMHTMNGLDLIRECRRIQPDQKIVLVSGTVDESIFQDQPEKPDRFLAKPYQARQFVSAIESVIKD